MNKCLAFFLIICSTTSLYTVSAETPDVDVLMPLLHVYFPSITDKTTIYDFLSDDKNVALLEKVHQHACMDLKRKRKIRSLDWLWNAFTLPIDQDVLNGTTFTAPMMFTLNASEEENFSKEGKFFNPYSPPNKDYDTVNLQVNVSTTPACTGKTQWPTNQFGEKVPKKHMNAIDYLNLINNEVDNAKNDMAAGGCPFGFS